MIAGRRKPPLRAEIDDRGCVTEKHPDRYRRRMALHVAKCKACAVALESADSGATAFHALCRTGKALLMPALSSAARDFVRREDAVLDGLDASKVRA